MRSQVLSVLSFICFEKGTAGNHYSSPFDLLLIPLIVIRIFSTLTSGNTVLYPIRISPNCDRVPTGMMEPNGS